MNVSLTDETVKLKRGIVAAVAAFTIAAALGLGFLTIIVLQIRDQNQDLTELSDLLDRPLVEEWSIEVAEDGFEVIVGEDPIPMLGLFRCSPQAIAANPAVRFTATFRPIGEGPTVNRSQSAAIPIVGTCNPATDPAPFPWPWTKELIEAFDGALLRPTEYRAVIEVASVDGSWLATSTITSNTFTLIPAAPTE